MALIKPSPLVNDLRGSVGGVTFGRNSAGMFARAKVTPINPDTALQIAVRAKFAIAAIAWRSTLNATERDAWNLLGTTTTFKNALGDDYNPSGIQLYIRSSVLLQLASASPVSTPPATAIVPVGEFTVAHLIATGIELTARPDPGLTNPLLITSISGPLSKGITFFKGPFAISGVFDAAEVAALPITLKPTSELIINSRYFIRFRVIELLGAASTDAIFVVDIGGVA